MPKSTTLPFVTQIQMTNIINLIGMRVIVLRVVRRIGCLVTNGYFSGSNAFRV